MQRTVLELLREAGEPCAASYLAGMVGQKTHSLDVSMRRAVRTLRRRGLVDCALAGGRLMAWLPEHEPPIVHRRVSGAQIEAPVLERLREWTGWCPLAMLVGACEPTLDDLDRPLPGMATAGPISSPGSGLVLATRTLTQMPLSTTAVATSSHTPTTSPMPTSTPLPTQPIGIASQGLVTGRMGDDGPEPRNAQLKQELVGA